MLMTDVKRGMNFWGRMHDSQTNSRSIFEAIVMHVEKCDYPHFKGYTVKSLVVIVKSTNTALIGKMQVIDFTDKQMEDFFENGNSHFVSMDNLYDVLHRYNPGDYYTGLKAAYFDENSEMMPMFSMLTERSPEYAFAILFTLNDKLIQIISLKQTYLTIDYENPYVWLNVVDSASELLLNEKPGDFFASGYIYEKLNNLFIEDLHENKKAREFFDDEFSLLSTSIFDTFEGIGFGDNYKLNLVIFDCSSHEGRVCYGSGIIARVEEK